MSTFFPDIRLRLSGRRPVRPLAISRRDASAAIARLAALTAAGVSTGDALASSSRSRTGGSGRLLGELHSAVRRGTSLSAAMSAGRFPFREAEIAVVRAGERGGSTAHALALLAASMEADSAGRRRIASALAYPLILVLGALGALAFLSTVVLPSFTSLYAGHELPGTTRSLLRFGELVRRWGAPAFASAVGAILVLRTGRRRSERIAAMFDRVAVTAPVVSVLVLPRVLHESTALLAMLLESGCEADESLVLASRAATNRTVAARIARVLRSLRHGVPLSVAWSAAALDRSGDAAPLFEIAEATGGYAQAFRRLATLERDAAEHALSQLCRLAEPVAVLTMAVAVGGGVLAVYQPMLGSASLLLGGTP